MNSMSHLPTLIFIHGSWHKPSCYDKVIKLLSDHHKLKCVAVALASTADSPNATFKDDIDIARAAISNETSAGHHVVVISHSYGGMVGNSAIKGFTRPKSASNPDSSTSTISNHGNVIGLILIASGFTLTGLSFMDPFFGIPPPAWRVNKETGFAELVTSPRELFYHDLPEEEANYWVSQLTTQSLKALFEGGEHAYAGWQDVPVYYIGTIEDRALPVVVQRMTVGMARGMGGMVEHRELQTSHSPFLSMPDETVAIIVEAVENFAGQKIDDVVQEEVSDLTKRKILVPAIWLSRPGSWLRYGLPLSFGRVIGGIISSFLWTKSLLKR